MSSAIGYDCNQLELYLALKNNCRNWLLKVWYPSCNICHSLTFVMSSSSQHGQGLNVAVAMSWPMQICLLLASSRCSMFTSELVGIISMPSKALLGISLTCYVMRLTRTPIVCRRHCDVISIAIRYVTSTVNNRASFGLSLIDTYCNLDQRNQDVLSLHQYFLAMTIVVNVCAHVFIC